MSQTSELVSDTETPTQSPIPVDTIKQTVTLSDNGYKFEYGIFEVSTYDVQQVSKNFFSKSKMDTDILPPVTRWVSKDMEQIAVERPPFSVTITYDDIHFEEGPINEIDDYNRCESCDPEYGCDCGFEAEQLEYHSFEFHLNIPWTIWFFKLENQNSNTRYVRDASIFCSPTSIQSANSALYVLPLPNLYADNRVCWGNSLLHPDKYNNFSSYILGCINTFWISNFNNDLTCNVGAPDLGDFANTRRYLELYSRLSMDEILSANFQPYMEFDKYCELISKKPKNTEEDKSNNISKFFKDLVI